MKKSDTVPCLLTLGLDNSGKTSILKNLSDEAPMTNPGFNVKTIARSDCKAERRGSEGHLVVQHRTTTRRLVTTRVKN